LYRSSNRQQGEVDMKEGHSLVEEFKREVSGVLRKKLIKVERPPTSIEQWYECATNLDRH